jgi:OOP family OmpA-OmpF porin
MNHIKFFTVVIGLCALTQLGYSQYSASTSGYTSYNNYDFVPGDTVIFSDNFTDDKAGKSPSRWKLAGGKGSVDNMAGLKVFAFTNTTGHGRMSPKMEGNAHLSDAFTLEFDNYSKGSGMPWVYLYKSAADANAASNNLRLTGIGSPNGGTDEIEYKNPAANINLTSNFPDEIRGENYLNKWHHIAIAYKKNEVKVYVDQYKVLVIPNLGFAPRAIGIEAVKKASPQNPVMIANFRIANGGGGITTADKKFTDAKIITHGINFNISLATITPESMGTLNMIAGIMRDNADLKFEIDGHTDNTGNPAHNLALSEQRAEEVRRRLMALDIDGSRLTVKGFGDTKPLSGNRSAEGKANNRRVEFVRVK